MLRIAALCSLCWWAAAVEGPLIDIPGADGQPKTVLELSKPAAPAPPRAIVFTWDNYRSIVVVGDGIGSTRPAWVMTSELPLVSDNFAGVLTSVINLFGYREPAFATDTLAVAYRAQAWLDAQGRLQIVASQAVLVGPQADQWSPDSFMFTFPHRVETVDDQQRGNLGVIEEIVDPTTNPQRFNELQTKVQVIVGDGI